MTSTKNGKRVRGKDLETAIRGHIRYSLGADFDPVDAFYFSVSTLTTTSVSDPDLVLQDGWLKIFAVFYQLVGIGVLVEVLRRLGIAFIAVRAAEKSS